MLDINRYRLNLYELLYKYPLCNYMTKTEDVYRRTQVMFIGGKEKAVETYKTMFWASQYPDSILHMTYCGEAEEIDYVKGIFEDKVMFPAFDEYLEKGYAEEPDYIDDNGILTDTRYHYIIIATGDAYKDWELLVKLESVYGNSSDFGKQVMLAVYNAGLADKLASLNWDKVSKNVNIIQFEMSDQQIKSSDLKRVAANMNLAYSLMYDQRLNVESNLKEFDNMCNEEFEIINSDKYDADSSYASAVSISSKLAYCLEYAKESGLDTEYNGNEAVSILTTAIARNNDLYKQLYYWEHKRWNAYMVMRGYRQPQKDEWDFVYSHGNKNVDIKRKLHVCLCESGKQLNQDMNNPSFWKSVKNKLDPLDYVSYSCNLIASNKTKEIENNIYNKYSFLNGILFKELKESIENLFLDVGNANDDFRRTYNFYLQFPEVQSNRIIREQFEQLNEDINVVIIRNKHIDFFKYDAQLVKLIPFVLWYGRKYSEVFVFSQGIAAKDVIIPTLLYAKQAYFVSDTVVDKYKMVIKRYFEERGDNTKVQFISYDEMLKLVDSKRIDNYVITGEGEEKEDFISTKNKVVNVRYDIQKNEIKNRIFVGLNNQSISVREFIRLQGGDVQAEYRDTLSRKTYAEYEKLFWNFSETRNSGTYKYVPWNKVIKIFTEDSRQKNGALQIENKNVLLTANNKDMIYVCDICLSQEKYLNNLLDNFLITLSDYHLIGNFNVVLKDKNVNIQFITYHKEICEIVESYQKQDAECIIADLVMGKKKLNRNDLIIQYSKDICIAIDKSKNRNEFRAQYYEPLLKELKSLGAIYDYQVKDGMLISVLIKDMRIILNLFEKEGDIFEKIAYHRFRNSAFFDDVRNGVYFYWNRDIYDRASQQKKLKNMLDDISKADIVGLIDADTFCEVHNKVYSTEIFDYDKSQVSNEIDVIATRGMQAYFISCKAASDIVMGYELEIANHAKNAGAVPVLCTSKKLSNNSDAVLSRASEVDKIVFIGKDELMEQNDFNNQIEQLMLI